MVKYNTVILSDTVIDYTDAERSQLKYTYEDVIKTAKAIKADRNLGPMLLEDQHRAAHKALMHANGNRKLSLPEYNHALTAVLNAEKNALRPAINRSMYS